MNFLTMRPHGAGITEGYFLRLDLRHGNKHNGFSANQVVPARMTLSRVHVIGGHHRQRCETRHEEVVAAPQFDEIWHCRFS